MQEQLKLKNNNNNIIRNINTRKLKVFWTQRYIITEDSIGRQKARDVLQIGRQETAV